MPNYIFLEGTAGIGKTTCIKGLQEDGYTCVFNDYFEMSQQNPIYLNKHGNMAKTMNYDLQQNLIMLQYTNSRADRIIFDRSPFASVLYTYIGQVLQRSTVDNDVISKEVYEMAYKYDWVKYKKMCVIVWINTNCKEIVKRMKARNNGLDTISKKYVKVQNMVFKAFANVMEFPLCNTDGMTPSDLKYIIKTYRPNLELASLPSSDDEEEEDDDKENDSTVANANVSDTESPVPELVTPPEYQSVDIPNSEGEEANWLQNMLEVCKSKLRQLSEPQHAFDTKPLEKMLNEHQSSLQVLEQQLQQTSDDLRACTSNHFEDSTSQKSAEFESDNSD